jgi:urease accessory protein
VQKALYPEGERVCHAIVLHPPGGIAGGDSLDIGIEVASGAHALLTTPGATKWYRSAGAQASQHVGIRIERDAVCEWMPQENIFYAAAKAQNALAVDLAPGAVFCGWDVMCLGRTASGEVFHSGRLRQNVRVTRGNQLLFEELGILEGGSALLNSPTGMAGYPICATFILAGMVPDRAVLETCRAVVLQGDCRYGISALEDMMLARCLASNAEAAREYFLKIWAQLRPLYANVTARAPRIWAT